MSSGPDKMAKLNELLDAAWREYRDDITKRVEAVRAAGELARLGGLTEVERARANSEAHKLAGVLGTFGLKQASTAAIELENLLAPGAVLGPELLQKFDARMRVIDEAIASKDSR